MTKTIRRDERGLAHVGMALLAVVVIAAIAFAGYRVLKNGGNNPASAGNSQSSQAASIPKQIKTQADLTQADKALNSISIDNNVNPDSLNSDIKALK